MLLLFSFDGRISRTTYWVCCAVPGFCVGLILKNALSSPGVKAIVTLACVWPSLALHAKRWHDQNRSGWWQLIGIVPGIGMFTALVMCGFVKGTDGPNDFGPSTDSWG